MQTKIEALQAEYGDCIFVAIEDEGNKFYILIDGGTRNTYIDMRMGFPVPGVLRQKIDDLKSNGEHIDLMVITHIDDDHIEGILEWFAHDFPDKDFLREVWFNDNMLIPTYESTDNCKGKAIDLKILLDNHGVKYRNQIIIGQQYPFVWGKIHILAPCAKHHNKIAGQLEEEFEKKNQTNNSNPANYDIDIDKLMKNKWKISLTASNESSIAFLLATNDGMNHLLLGDADINVVIKSLKALGYKKDNKLVCDTVKLAHHGSRNNFKDEFLDMISVEKFIVSTDGTCFGHPDKEVIAHIITKTESDILFNYMNVLNRLFTSNDKKAYPSILTRCKSIDALF